MDAERLTTFCVGTAVDEAVDAVEEALPWRKGCGRAAGPRRRLHHRGGLRRARETEQDAIAVVVMKDGKSRFMAGGQCTQPLLVRLSLSARSRGPIRLLCSMDLSDLLKAAKLSLVSALHYHHIFLRSSRTMSASQADSSSLLARLHTSHYLSTHLAHDSRPSSSRKPLDFPDVDFNLGPIASSSSSSNRPAWVPSPSALARHGSTTVICNITPSIVYPPPTASTSVASSAQSSSTLVPSINLTPLSSPSADFKSGAPSTFAQFTTERLSEFLDSSLPFDPRVLDIPTAREGGEEETEGLSVFPLSLDDDVGTVWSELDEERGALLLDDKLRCVVETRRDKGCGGA